MQRIIQRKIASSARCLQAMKPGTPIPGLNFLKGKEAPVAMERSEYPDWVNDLENPNITLAKLRRMDEEDATDSEKMRYLKLTRRAVIKESNLEAGAK
mmetsp:Transcript_10980/g.18201  ORF Transcript_10980/g.18201 Transcript_10980/m.18201 type:complete len:98 (-) Transcript_10980:148-441(-)|eukprot:CAMPEP_0119003476 /NCGR_PEP_ID=MMETSP1176-20130426/585_1 /TAXON_ID=265551 /ORGANISM="Synedropsis recta cf, Strain CCMP1620" /LENGTH=97 /DNA_ID=CAMNT_0006955085 /DNA_START=135 /DNA_END=428 /DNA_ORIENTATION=+